MLLATTFLGAFLLFQVQPLIGKIILPWFGGSASVWTICLLFFQTLLFAGYLYAHLVSSYLRPLVQTIVHSTLLVVAVLLMPILPQRPATGLTGVSPTFAVLGLLAASVGLPYFLLSSTAPLVQRWWSVVVGRSPYHLYALSNAGSLLALLTYSFVFERWLGTTIQAWAWSGAFVVMVALLLTSQWFVWRSGGWNVPTVAEPDVALDEAAPDDETASPTRAVAPPGWGVSMLWLGLAALGSAVLMALTTMLCQDIANLPLLWIAPLTLYLLSFILCFGRASWYRRSWYMPLMVLGSFGVSITFGRVTPLRIIPLFALTLGTLFVTCMVCHGELERLKPAPRHLTRFYLFMSAGGMIGGIFVALVAPLVFNEYFELPLLMIVCTMIPMVWLARSPDSPMAGGRRSWLWLLVLLVFAVHSALWSVALLQRHVNVVLSSRSFYGVLKVLAEDTPNIENGGYWKLVHGNIDHGGQFLHESRWSTPTSYYGPASGVGRVMQATEDRPSRRIGAVGLGTGTVAAYARKGDEFRFYEIDPDVQRISEGVFKYLHLLDEAGATRTVVLGDARLMLESEPPQQFDVLIVDAFSGDSIPVHLLTREAGAVYLRHLKSDGYLALHISNNYVNLVPVTADIAREYGLNWALIPGEADESAQQVTSLWVLLTHGEFPGAIPGVEFVSPDRLTFPPVGWTDQRSSLLEVLTF